MSTSDKSAGPSGADEGSAVDLPDADGAQVTPAGPVDTGSADTGSASTETEVAPEGPAEGGPAQTPPTGAAEPPRATAAGRVWVGLIVGVVLIVLLIIFIAENSTSVRLSFLGAHGRISLGLAMLAAAVVGAVVTLLVGTTRILQLRREVRRSMRHL